MVFAGCPGDIRRTVSASEEARAASNVFALPASQYRLSIAINAHVNMACTGTDSLSHELIKCMTRQVTKVPAVAMTSAISGSVHHQKAGHSNPGQAKDQEAAGAKVPRQTHADLVAQMRQADEPLSVEGELFVFALCWSTVEAVIEALHLFSDSLRLESLYGVIVWRFAAYPLHPLLDPETLLIIWMLYVKFLLVLKGRFTTAIVSCRQNLRQLCGNSISLHKRHVHHQAYLSLSM